MNQGLDRRVLGCPARWVRPNSGRVFAVDGQTIGEEQDDIVGGGDPGPLLRAAEGFLDAFAEAVRGATRQVGWLLDARAARDHD